jgi:hypothetical protein
VAEIFSFSTIQQPSHRKPDFSPAAQIRRSKQQIIT